MESRVSQSATIPRGLLALTEADVRRKGTQAGSVRQRGGSWFIRFQQWTWIDGRCEWREVERKIDTGTHKRVDERIAARLGYEQHVRAANQLNKTPQGLSDFATFVEQKYLPTMRGKKLSHQWELTIESALRLHIVPAFGSLQMSEIRRPMVQEWVTRLASDHKPATVKRYLFVLQDVFHLFGDLYDADAPNPANRVTLPRQRAAERVPLTLDQARQVAAALTVPQYSRLVMFLALSGMRLGEVRELRWGAVDLAAGRITVTRSKTGKSRTVPIVDELRAALLAELGATKWSGMEHAVFASSVGTAFSVKPFRIALTAALKVCGFQGVTIHDLRHTARSWMDQHLSVREAMAVLGHSTPQMSMHYAHVEADEIQRKLRKDVVN
jgi:integrase